MAEDRDPPGPPPPEQAVRPSGWVPPDVARSDPPPDDAPPPAGGVHVEVEPPDGPPPNPVVRRRRRRLLVGVAIVALLALVIPVVLAVVALRAGGEQDPVAGGQPGDEDAEPGPPEDPPDSEAPPEAGDGGTGDPAPMPDAPDLDDLDGTDAVLARLLIDIDASERTMLAAQDDWSDAVGEHGGSDAPALLEALGDAAATRAGQLRDLRQGLVDELGDDPSEPVRETYLVHLDSWIDYLEGVGDDPRILLTEGATTAYIVSINRTADAFARALGERLDEDTDEQVRRFGEGVLDRGFRSDQDAQV